MSVCLCVSFFPDEFTLFVSGIGHHLQDFIVNPRLQKLLTPSYTTGHLSLELSGIVAPLFLQKDRGLGRDRDLVGLTAASTFAGDSKLGSASMEITEMRMVSTVWTGSQRSAAFSYPYRSSPGSCRMEMHTLPTLSIFGCQISVRNFIFGGRCGYSFGKFR